MFSGLGYIDKRRVMESKIQGSGEAQFDIARTVALSFSAASTLVLLVRLLIRCSYGIDITDEGFHLVYIADPCSYDVATTQFAFVYHPLFRFVSGDVVLFRQANTLITFGLAWCFLNLAQIVRTKRDAN